MIILANGNVDSLTPNRSQSPKCTRDNDTFFCMFCFISATVIELV